MAGAQATIISKGMRARKLDINPIESTSSLEYCRFCKDEVSVELDEGKWGSIWVYRKRCLRCGKRIQWGLATVNLTNPDPQTLQDVQDAIAWMKIDGEDRS